MFVSVKDLTMHVLVSGPPGAPPLVLLHSLGATAHVWDEQVAELSRCFRVIRPDLRGHGLTTCTPGPYAMELFADDLAALLDTLGISQAHIGGISIGGLISQAFAAAHPERVTSLLLVDTAMAIPTVQSWTERAAKVRAEGIASIVDGVMARWVTPAFIGSASAEGLRAMLLRTPVEGYAASVEAIAVADLSVSTGRLSLPTLIIVGDQDQSTPVASAQALNQAIAGSSLVVIENAAHIPLVEKPKEITSAMMDFFKSRNHGLL